MNAWFACAALACAVAHGAAAVELARGTRGHGFSVFEGETPTRFEVEILGVMHDAASTGDTFLARLSGAGLEHTGILQGMSGSPVYVDGELVGAVMATWAFAKEPLCTIRPIEEMRALADGLQAGEHPGYRPGDSKVLAPALDPPRRDAATLFEAPAPQWPASSAGVLWSAGGFAPQIVGAMQDRLGTPMQSLRSGPPGASASQRLEAGDAIAVMLVDGAATLSAVGTVTERDGDRILAFGHPMLGIGAVSLPIARATVLGAMPSTQISFKISELGSEVGALLLDQRPGIVGMLGVQSQMLPVSVRVEDRDYEFRIGRVAALLPDLAAWCARAALLDRDPVGDDAQLQLVARAEFEDEAPLASEAAVDGGLAGVSVGAELALLTQLAISRPEWASRLQSLHLEIRRDPIAQRARVDQLFVRPQRPRAGDELTIRVALRHDDASIHWRELSLRIPEGQPAGPMRLHVGDGGASFRDELMRAPSRWEDPGTAAIREALSQRAAANVLVATLYAPARSVLVGDRELGPLPASMRALLLDGAGRAAAGEVAASALASARSDTPWLLRGQQVVEFEIEAPPARPRKESP